MMMRKPALAVCDCCRKIISISGIQIREIRAKQFRVQYFSCPHCGYKFHVATFDQKQEKILRQQRQLAKRIAEGMEKHKTKDEVEKYRRRLLRLTDCSRERRKELEIIGKRLCSGESLDGTNKQ